MDCLKEQVSAILKVCPLIEAEVAKQIADGTFYLQPGVLSAVYKKHNKVIQPKDEAFLLNKIKFTIYSQIEKESE